MRNQAETLIYETEKNLKEIGDKLSDEEKTTIENAKEDLSKALENGTVDDIKAKTDALTEQFHTISAKMYEQAQANAGAAGAGMGPDMGAGMGAAPGADQGASQGSGAADDNVVDADFEVVDDDENK